MKRWLNSRYLQLLALIGTLMLILFVRLFILTVAENEELSLIHIFLAEKNILLMQKMEHITKRTTREKLLSYLSSQAVMKGSSSFEIPFNRQELADYLAVDRSAMSAELARMRDDGLLRFRKNRFTLL